MSFEHKTGDSVVKGDFSRLEKLIESLESPISGDIGILGGEQVEGGITLAGIGAVHEFGTDKAGRGNNTKIPERSFLRMPLETGQEDIEKAIAPKLQEYIENGNVKGIMELILIAGEARIQEAFESGGFGKWPKLADPTTQRKGSAGILIDTGVLRQGITSRVNE